MSTVKWIAQQAFAPYHKWECFISGFHDVSFSDEHAKKSKELYENIPALRAFVFRLLNEWPITVSVHLSQNRNYRAWIGHAACFLSHGAGMHSSIEAYWRLTDKGRDDANNCVMEGYSKWRLKNMEFLQAENCQEQSAQLAFQF